MIPLILHRTVPAAVDAQLEEWWQRWGDQHNTPLHGWEHRTWRDPLDPDDFPITSPVWHRCTSGAQLAGLVRLEVLWWHGGIYVDADVEPVPNGPRLDALLHVGPCFVCTEDGEHLTDAVIGAEPQHPAIYAAMHRARLMLDEPDPVPNAAATGPLNLTAVWRGRDDVTVLAARAFYPFSYLDRVVQDRRPASDFPDSFGVHRWRFSWAGT